jgi:hypothetical protein
MRSTRSIFSIGLITLGTGLFVLSLWMSMANKNVSLIIGSIGLVIGVGGWLLQNVKTPMSLIRNISSAVLITIGAGLFILPLFILSIYGTNVAYVNIALMNFVVGLVIGLIGFSVRNQRVK